MEFYRDRKKYFLMVFIDFENTYDMIPEEALWTCLEKKDVPFEHTCVIRYM